VTSDVAVGSPKVDQQADVRGKASRSNDHKTGLDPKSCRRTEVQDPLQKMGYSFHPMTIRISHSSSNTTSVDSVFHIPG
jgi:hypothetical protein